jgi:hypothetical protein
MTAVKNFADLITEHRITIDSEYVIPGPGLSELKWNVELRVDGRKVHACTYTAGISHAPSYPAMVAYDECQTGLCLKHGKGYRQPLRPDIEGVISSLCLDAGAIDHACFEDWAREFGYDTDSRAAEKSYRECIDTALRLRAALGSKAFEELQDHARSL